jgi:hypothetical protein
MGADCRQWARKFSGSGKVLPFLLVSLLRTKGLVFGKIVATGIRGR